MDSSVPPNAHYLAEIKYPRIADAIALDKILSVLQKIRDTSKPISYKWTVIDRPKDGELFLEQKFPITRDPINGDQFPIVDDGYLWSSIPKPEIREIQGQTVEVYRWCEGYAPGDFFFSVTKMEYRLKMPGNILFLIHYLIVRNACVPIRPALPASKISPLYLQQQFQDKSGPVKLKLNVPSVPMSTPHRVASPKLRPEQLPNTPASSLPIVNDQLNSEYFDAFTEYEAAAYRLNSSKSLLNLIFESTGKQESNEKKNPIEMNPSLTDDLVAAMKKKTQTIQTRITRHEQEHSVLISKLEEESKEFLKQCQLLKQASTEADLEALLTQ